MEDAGMGEKFEKLNRKDTLIFAGVFFSSHETKSQVRFTDHTSSVVGVVRRRRSALTFH